MQQVQGDVLGLGMPQTVWTAAFLSSGHLHLLIREDAACVSVLSWRDAAPSQMGKLIWWGTQEQKTSLWLVALG